MNLIEQFNKFDQTNLNLNNINEILTLQDAFLREKNYDYYFLCTNIIIDIYINDQNLDEALSLALSLYEKDEIKEFTLSYKRTIDQLIYIYITKQYYKRALSLLELKKTLIDHENSDEINRLYLEYSYIHEGLGEKHASLVKLNSILSNEPTNEIKAVALNNITKLYIDNNNFEEAKIKLKENILLVNEINDAEGIRYCQYLEGLIYHCEGEFKNSYKVLSKLYKDINKEGIDLNILQANFIYINEYYTLLLDLLEYKDAIDLYERYIDHVLKSNDLSNKLTFLRNTLRLNANYQLAFKKSKKNNTSLETIMSMISSLEKEIERLNGIKNEEIKEDEITLQMSNSERFIYSQLLTSLSDIVLNYDNGNIRTLLLSYSNKLKNSIKYDEALYVILNKDQDTVILNPFDRDDTIITFQYKNERLYERNLKYNDFKSTVLEKVLTYDKEVAISLDKEITYLDPINKIKLSDNFKYLMALPMHKNDKIFGVCIFLSKAFDFNKDYPKTLLNISTKLLAHSLVGLFNKNINELQTNLIETSELNSKSGLFYYNVTDGIYILSNKCKELLGLNETKLLKSEYCKHIAKNDLRQFLQTSDKQNKKLSYDVKYHFNTSTNNILVTESASPFVSKLNKLYYCGRITVFEFDAYESEKPSKLRALSERDLSIYLQTHLDEKINLVAIKSKYDIFNKLANLFDDNIYRIENYFYIISFDSVKVINNKLSDREFMYTILVYPDKVIKVDDLIPLSRFVIKNKGYNELTNSNYAQFINNSSNEEILERAILDENITINKKVLYACNDKVGYYIDFSVSGLYSLDVLDKMNVQICYYLYESVIKKLDKENIYLIKIRNEVLYNLLQNNKLNDYKIIFDLKDNQLASNILLKIKDTNCKVLCSLSFMKNLTLNAIDNAFNCIIGFNESIDTNTLKVFNIYKNNYLFYGDNGFRIEDGE